MLDLTRLREVPDVPALASLRRPTLKDAFRRAWTPRRTLAVAALSPLAFWAYASFMEGRATSGPAWVALTALLAVGAAFVATTYAGRGQASGSCALAPLLGLGLAGWLVTSNPTLLGVGFAASIVAVGAVQRVTRPAC